MDLQERFNAVIESFFKNFPFPSPVVIAVSGGVDSMCLTLLLTAFFEKKGWNKKDIHPVIINHKLRVEAAHEAKQVVELLKQYFGLKGEILTWDKDEVTTCIQEKARKARYSLLSTYCKRKNIPYLMTAHHADDQIETFLMRAKKKSGVKGLVGIPKVRESNFGYIIRPILDFFKEELIAMLESKGVQWIEDPSNEKNKYQRNRLRKTVKELTKNGIERKAVLHRIKALEKANETLDLSIEKFLKKYFSSQTYGWWKMEYPVWLLDLEIYKRVINKVSLLYTKKGTYPPRGRQYRHNYEKLKKGEPVTFRGLYFLPKKNELFIFREISFCERRFITKEMSKEIIWDKRLKLNIESFRGRRGTIAPLTAKGWQQLLRKGGSTVQKRKKEAIPGAALFSLPAFWQENKKFPELIQEIKSINI